ncbi:hypothetical protein BWZ20_02550 [Winogradskyella sp. J14-2]|uniref:DUF1801 domain-containing protein n=1 Tax=Winogradskyella sp. J14-2 TaxID=1936080 RepID=UPI000972942B|nr:DUF1801 domain-containing protein [Winogradskyella sp. J14-2]APY07252.1 hypothetical protein BWZ20_02550 [Winogradskyella sp. J14-2]
MHKARQPLSTKQPPIPEPDYKVIEDWLANCIMPGITPMLKTIDSLIHDAIPNLHYAIKWGNAYYGTDALGWLIEVAAYEVSANIVFLNGAAFDPQPPLGTGETRYIKLKTLDEVNDARVIDFIKQAANYNGWQ